MTELMPSRRILYIAAADAPGWEERRLMPRGSLTDLLAQELDYGENRLPKPGDRLRDYSNLQDPGNGVTHGRDGDWVVMEVEQFVSTSGREVITCYCIFEPIAPNWQTLNRQSNDAENQSLIYQNLN